VERQDNKYEFLRRRAEEDPEQRYTAIFALMPARRHPGTTRKPAAEGWRAITVAAGVVFGVGLLLALLGASGSAVREVGTALVSGSVVGLVFIFADKRVDRARALQERSSVARSALGSQEHLRGFSADHLDLYAADVHDAVLTSANFNRADLTQARFLGCNLVDAQFREATLVNGWIAFCKANGGDFAHANLQFSTCCYSSFADADLRGADLTSAALYGSSFPGADLTGTVLVETDCRGADLSRAKGLPEAAITGIRYDEWTRWPDGFAPPPPRGTGGRPAAVA
jgi:Pentapeptide repeats (8 copies)